MREEDEVKCPECDVVFAITWHISFDSQGGPTCCPFCGCEIDYEQADE